MVGSATEEPVAGPGPTLDGRASAPKIVGAPRDGVVEKVLCSVGDQVELGAPLVELEES